MKKWMLLVLAFALVFTLAACGGSGGETPDNGAANGTAGSGTDTGNADDAKKEEKKEDVTLRIAWWGGQPRHDYTLKVIEMYQQQNPHVKIEPEYASWDDYWKKLAPQAAANELPDIVQMDLSYLTQYGEKGQLADLTPFIGSEIDTSNISQGIVDGGKLGDKIYGFNLGVNALGFQYDPALLQKINGQTAIDPNWTWDDYMALAEKAKAANLYVDTGMRPEVFFSYYLRTQGKSLFSADGTSLGYEDDQLFIDHFSRLINIVHMGAGMTADQKAQLKGPEDDPAVKGEALGIWQWSNQFVGYQQLAKRELAMAPMVGPNAKQGLFLKPSMFFSISEHSKQKAEAAKFISFFVNDIEANKLILGDRGVPGSSAVKEALKPILSPQQAQVFDYVAWAEENSSQMDPPDPIGAAQVFEALKTITEEVEYKKISIEEGAKKFRDEANKILAQNKK
ncbi:ABC transporter substrate-binding protein [Paenibacillus alkalitolerans]|uniref:ABC transporter substrate-binding protein n=1 Tax=Paenibacillus alkalitolerans TaxID=2799335 RepID=UPI0018F7CE44|nr:extracellular solute-binding protein [Paenibacillus alkalitolerans]